MRPTVEFAIPINFPSLENFILSNEILSKWKHVKIFGLFVETSMNKQFPVMLLVEIIGKFGCVLTQTTVRDI